MSDELTILLIIGLIIRCLEAQDSSRSRTIRGLDAQEGFRSPNM